MRFKFDNILIQRKFPLFSNVLVSQPSKFMSQKVVDLDIYAPGAGSTWVNRQCEAIVIVCVHNIQLTVKLNDELFAQVLNCLIIKSEVNGRGYEKASGICHCFLAELIRLKE